MVTGRLALHLACTGSCEKELAKKRSLGSLGYEARDGRARKPSHRLRFYILHLEKPLPWCAHGTYSTTCLKRLRSPNIPAVQMYIIQKSRIVT